MTNLTQKLVVKFVPSTVNINTEEQVISLFEELKRDYQRLRDYCPSAKLEVLRERGERDYVQKRTLAKDYAEVLKAIAAGEVDYHHPLGFIFGEPLAEFLPRMIVYDLSEATGVIHDWDRQIREGVGCYTCNHYVQPSSPSSGFFANDDTAPECKKDQKLFSPNCLNYDPCKKNGEGKLARPIQELIEEFLQKSDE